MLALGPFGSFNRARLKALKEVAVKADVAVLAYHYGADPRVSFNDLYFSNSEIEEYGIGFWDISDEE